MKRSHIERYNYIERYYITDAGQYTIRKEGEDYTVYRNGDYLTGFFPSMEEARAWIWQHVTSTLDLLIPDLESRVFVAKRTLKERSLEHFLMDESKGE